MDDQGTGQVAAATVGEGGPDLSPEEQASESSEAPATEPTDDMVDYDSSASSDTGETTGEETGTDDSSSTSSSTSEDSDDADSAADASSDDGEKESVKKEDYSYIFQYSSGDDEDDEEMFEDDDEHEGQVEEGSDEIACENRSFEVDPSQGKWFVTPAGDVNSDHHSEHSDHHGEDSDHHGEDSDHHSEHSDHHGKDSDHHNRGIHSYNAGEKLVLKVNNNCQAGWYNLKVFASNYDGNLPDYYGYFNIDITGDTGFPMGGLFIKAKENGYHKGSTDVYLPQGSSYMVLTWTNDAYKEGKYDTNLHIGKIQLKYKKKHRSHHALKRSASDYCHVNGRWFWDKNGAFTFWPTNSISYCFDDLEPGKYEVTVSARNVRGDLPNDFEGFKLKVSGNGVAEDLTIPVSGKKSDKFTDGNTVLDLTGGRITLNFAWQNQVYEEGGYDSNIQIRKVSLKRVGDSERSALSGYLSNVSTAAITLMGIILLAVLGLAVVFVGRHIRSER